MILWSNFEEGGRTKEEGEMICGVWNEECGMKKEQLTAALFVVS